jgi:hypothetical protein
MAEQSTIRFLGMRTFETSAPLNIVGAPISTRQIGPAIGVNAQATPVGGATELPTLRRGST